MVRAVIQAGYSAMAFRISELLIAAFSVLFLASCGGGGGSGSSSASNGGSSTGSGSSSGGNTGSGSSGGGAGSGSSSGSGTDSGISGSCSSDSGDVSASTDQFWQTNLSVSLDVLNGKDSVVLSPLGSSDYYSYIIFGSYGAKLEVGDDGCLVLRFKPEALLDHDFVLKNEHVPYMAASSSKTVNGWIDISYGRDPMINHQWYIRTNTDDGYGLYDAESDMVDGLFYRAWRKGINGSGALVAVLDDGIEIKHPDLSANIASGSYNYEYQSYKNSGKEIPKGMTETDPTPASLSDAHGTNIAGIIAAVPGNDIGISGTAPGAKLIGFNVMSSLLSTYGQTAARRDAYRRILSLGNVDVINESFGNNDGSFYEDDYAASVYKALYDRGTVRVSSTGNCFATYDNYLDSVVDKERDKLATYCIWNQSGPGDYLPWGIKVGVVGAGGVHASYASVGTNLLVSGFSSDSLYLDTDIYTTDRTTCSAGYNKKGSDDDPECNYNASFTGTSAAAPTVSGLVALLKGKYPSMSASQVRWILAKSSRNDTVLPRLSYAPVYSGDILVDGGWVENDAGLRFSRRYGFGVIDASAALDEADGCASDAECSVRAKSPEEYTIQLSCNKAKTLHDAAAISNEVSSYVDNTDQQYKCTGSTMLDSSGKPVTGSFSLDSVLLTVGDLNFKVKDANGLSVCGSKALEHQDPENEKDTADYVNAVARSKLGLGVRTPGRTYSVLKSLFERTSGSLMPGYISSGAVSVNALTNAPMGEHVSAGQQWSADIYSWCDLEDGYDAELTVYAYPLN